MDIRLELIKLAHSSHLSPDEVIARAAQYEMFVLGNKPKPEVYEKLVLSNKAEPEVVKQRRTRGRRPADGQERLTA